MRNEIFIVRLVKYSFPHNIVLKMHINVYAVLPHLWLIMLALPFITTHSLSILWPLQLDLTSQQHLHKLFTPNWMSNPATIFLTLIFE